MGDNFSAAWLGRSYVSDLDHLQAVARHSEDFSGLKVDWQTQTLITAGATEALAATFLALINHGDEVTHLHRFCL